MRGKVSLLKYYLVYLLRYNFYVLNIEYRYPLLIPWYFKKILLSYNVYPKSNHANHNPARACKTIDNSSHQAESSVRFV